MAMNAPVAGGKRTSLALFIFPPVLHIAWGIVLILANLAANMMQVQSTQAWFLYEAASWRLNFAIWGQFAQFWNGQMDPRHTVAFIASWGAQIVLMTIKLGTGYISSNALARNGNPAHHDEAMIKQAEMRMALWNILSWLIVIIDTLTDWGFSSGMGFWQQMFFCSITFLGTFYCGTWGIQNLVAGIGRMRK